MFELIGVTLFVLAIFGFSLVLASSPDRHNSFDQLSEWSGADSSSGISSEDPKVRDYWLWRGLKEGDVDIRFQRPWDVTGKVIVKKSGK